MVLMAVDVVAVLAIKPHGQIELPVALEHRARHGAGHGGLNDGIHVPGVQPVSSGLDAIDFDIEIRLTDDVEDADDPPCP